MSGVIRMLKKVRRPPGGFPPIRSVSYCNAPRGLAQYLQGPLGDQVVPPGNGTFSHVSRSNLTSTSDSISIRSVSYRNGNTHPTILPSTDSILPPRPRGSDHSLSTLEPNACGDLTHRQTRLLGLRGARYPYTI